MASAKKEASVSSVASKINTYEATEGVEELATRVGDCSGYSNIGHLLTHGKVKAKDLEIVPIGRNKIILRDHVSNDACGIGMEQLSATVKVFNDYEKEWEDCECTLVAISVGDLIKLYYKRHRDVLMDRLRRREEREMARCRDGYELQSKLIGLTADDKDTDHGKESKDGKQTDDGKELQHESKTILNAIKKVIKLGDTMTPTPLPVGSRIETGILIGESSGLMSWSQSRLNLGVEISSVGEKKDTLETFCARQVFYSVSNVSAIREVDVVATKTTATTAAASSSTASTATAAGAASGATGVAILYKPDKTKSIPRSLKPKKEQSKNRKLTGKAFMRLHRSEAATTVVSKIKSGKSGNSKKRKTKYIRHGDADAIRAFIDKLADEETVMRLLKHHLFGKSLSDSGYTDSAYTFDPPMNILNILTLMENEDADCPSMLEKYKKLRNEITAKPPSRRSHELESKYKPWTFNCFSQVPEEYPTWALRNLSFRRWSYGDTISLLYHTTDYHRLLKRRNGFKRTGRIHEQWYNRDHWINAKGETKSKSKSMMEYKRVVCSDDLPPADATLFSEQQEQQDGPFSPMHDHAPRRPGTATLMDFFPAEQRMHLLEQEEEERQRFEDDLRAQREMIDLYNSIRNRDDALVPLDAAAAVNDVMTSLGTIAPFDDAVTLTDAPTATTATVSETHDTHHTLETAPLAKDEQKDEQKDTLPAKTPASTSLVQSIVSALSSLFTSPTTTEDKVATTKLSPTSGVTVHSDLDGEGFEAV